METAYWNGVGRPCQHIPGAGRIKDRRTGGILMTGTHVVEKCPELDQPGAHGGQSGEI